MSEELTRCESCNYDFPDDILEEVDGKNYCPHCLSESFVLCHDCDNWVRQGDAVNIRDHQYCWSCVDNIRYGRFLEYDDIA